MNQPTHIGDSTRDQSARDDDSQGDGWFIAQKGKKKEGPYTLDELQRVLLSHDQAENLNIRSSKKSEWIPFAEAARRR